LNWERIIRGIDTFCEVGSVGDVNGYDGVGAKMDLLLRFGIILFEVDAINNNLIAPVQTCTTDRKGLSTDSLELSPVHSGLPFLPELHTFSG